MLSPPGCELALGGLETQELLLTVDFCIWIFFFFPFWVAAEFFSHPWTFQPCRSAEEWHFQDKAASYPSVEAAKLGVFAVLSQM